MKQVRYARERRGWSMDELARRARVSKTHLWSVESGESAPSVPVFLRLAEALGLTMDQLYGTRPIVPCPTCEGRGVICAANYQAMESLTSVEVGFLDNGLDVLDLTVRAANSLAMNSIKTVRDLVSKSAADVMGFRNAGRTTLRNIKERLAANGLMLRDE